MATHSSVLAWRIPGMGEPGGLLFMGSHRVGHDWSDLAVCKTKKMKIMASGPITSWEIDGETVETGSNFILGAPKSLQMVTAAMKLRRLASWKKSYDQPRQHVKKQRYYFANKGPSSQSFGFSSSHVWMWELDYKESWARKNWWFWTVVLEKTLESPLDSKEIQPKGNQT